MLKTTLRKTRNPLLALLASVIASVIAGAATAQDAPADAAPLPDPLAAGWQGNATCERLHEDSKQRILRCSFPPGVGHERHYHVEHFGYALSGGRMRITDATGVREAQLTTGSYFTSDGVDWHEVVNIGETTVVYLMIEPKPAVQ